VRGEAPGALTTPNEFSRAKILKFFGIVSSFFIRGFKI